MLGTPSPTAARWSASTLPNAGGATGNTPPDKCEITANGSKMVRRVYGSEMGPVGMTLVSTQVPRTDASRSLFSDHPGKLTFQLPAEFKTLADRDSGRHPDPVRRATTSASPHSRPARSRPAGNCIPITQSGQSKTAWDSRREEGRHSSSEWLIKRYSAWAESVPGGVRSTPTAPPRLACRGGR